MTYEDKESQGCQDEEQADVDKARLKAQEAVSHWCHFSVSLKIYIRWINSRSSMTLVKQCSRTCDKLMVVSYFPM